MSSQANTKHLYNICTTPAQCPRRWPNIVQMLYKCFVFAGSPIIPETWMPDIEHVNKSVSLITHSLILGELE